MRGIFVMVIAAAVAWVPAGAQSAGERTPDWSHRGQPVRGNEPIPIPDAPAPGIRAAFLGGPVGIGRASGGVGLRDGVGDDGVAADSSSGDPFITGDDALLAVLFAAGGMAIAPVDRYFAERLQNPRNQENRFLRYTAGGFNAIGFPGSLIIGSGLYAYGRLRDDRETAALGLHGLEAIIVGSLAAGGFKAIVGRARPYMDVTNPHDFGFLRGAGDERYRSFPSGHTVAGFAAATVVTKETARWWPNSEWYIAPVMYGGATLIGASRMYTNNHWASDVVIGAAIGTLAGMILDRWHHRRPDNWIDRNLLPDEERDAAQPVAPPIVFLWSIPMPR